MKAKRRLTFAKWRDVTTYVGGMIGIGYQLITNVVHPLLATIFAGMIGLPIALNALALRNFGIGSAQSSLVAQPSPSTSDTSEPTS